MHRQETGEPTLRRSLAATAPALRWVFPAVALIAASALWWRATDGLLLSQDANWDLKNYHAYNGWAVFNEGLSRDLHPAAIQSYLNPLIDIPTFALVSLVPSAIGTLLLSAWHLLVAIPLFLIARALAPAASPAVWLTAAICGIGGAVTISEIGTTFGDATAAPLIVWGIWFSLADQRRHILFGAGLVGTAIGLKLTMAPFGLGLPVLLLVLHWRRRGARAVGWVVWQTLAQAAGFLLVTGFWMVHLARSFGSPIFPFYNGFFGSPYASADSGDDGRFGASAPIDLLALPLRLADAAGSNADPGGLQTSELPSADLRWLAWVVLGLALALAAVVRRRRVGTPAGPESAPLLLGLWLYSAAVYVIWLVAFGIQRYAIPLEMLIGVLVVVSAGLVVAMGGRRTLADLTACGVGLVLIATTVPVTGWGRVPLSWTEPALPLAASAELSSFRTLLVPTPPIAYAAVTTGRSGLGPSWVGPAFNEADRQRALPLIQEPVGVLVRAGVPDPAEVAGAIADSYGVGATSGWACTSVPTGFGEENWLCTRRPPA
jgi:hypothetical protein